MTRLSRLVAIGATLLATNVLAAQVRDSTRPFRPLRGARGAAVQGGRARGTQAPGRTALENQVRQAMATAVRRQLQLDDRQMRELKRTDDKFDAERRGLTRDERVARQTLRAALEDSVGGDSAIAQAMTRMLQIQRRRLDLLEAEQKDLATFMTPRQRAQYFALRERILRRVMEMQQGGRRGGSPPAKR